MLLIQLGQRLKRLREVGSVVSVSSGRQFVSVEAECIVTSSPSYSKKSLEEFGALDFVYGDGSMFFW